MDALWQWDVMFKVLKVKIVSQKFCQTKLSFKTEGKIHTFLYTPPLKEFFAMNSDIQEKPKRGFQVFKKINPDYNSNHHNQPKSTGEDN